KVSRQSGHRDCFRYGGLDLPLLSASALKAPPRVGLQCGCQSIRATHLENSGALAKEMAPHTRVNSVAPSFVPARLSEVVLGNETMRKSIEESSLLKRVGTTSEMATAAAFLASDDASFLT
ncbi:hypothetical protein Tsubulata_014428, partial [Turnera subulata]